MTRPASRPLASCQSLVYSFPRDAMWRSWAASCLCCFFYSRALSPPSSVLIVRCCFCPLTEPPFFPRRVHLCAGRRRLHAPPCSAASNRCISRAPKKGWPAVMGTCTPASEHTGIPGQSRGRCSSWSLASWATPPPGKDGHYASPAFQLTFPIRKTRALLTILLEGEPI